MTIEKYLAWLVIVLPIVLSLTCFVVDPLSIKNKWIGFLFFLLRLLWIMLGLALLVVAIGWAVSVVSK